MIESGGEGLNLSPLLCAFPCHHSDTWRAYNLLNMHHTFAGLGDREIDRPP